MAAAVVVVALADVVAAADMVVAVEEVVAAVVVSYPRLDLNCFLSHHLGA